LFVTPPLRSILAPVLAGTILALALLAPGAFGASSGSQAPANGTTGSTGSTGSTGALGGLVASVTACHADALTANRYAIFASQMTQVAGGRTMAVSFVLQERTAGSAAFSPVSAPGFGAWVSSQRGVAIFTYDHEVTALPAPAAFRVVVRARWIDRRHRVIHRATILSPVCRQPLLQPDLAIGEPLARSAGTQPGTVVYSVVVRNLGTAAAGPFQVSLSIGGVALPAVAVASLGVDSTQLVEFTGPRCAAGSTLVATADSGDAVTEPANADRTRTFACTR
jgi:hypothetical protein